MEYSFTPGLSEITLEPFGLQYVRNTEEEKYYRIFTLDNEIKNHTFNAFFLYSPDVKMLYDEKEITERQLENLIYTDEEFQKTLPIGNYGFKDYTDFRNMFFRKNSITQNVVIQPIAATFHYNQNKKRNIKHPWNIYARGEVSGALLRLADAVFKFPRKAAFFNDEQALVGGVPFSEFVRLDLDVRKTFNLTEKTAIALRSFTGVAIPYGNSEFIPFIRSYFGGGSNDIRAWQAYELSPAPLRPNDKGTYIDNMKITWNAEYRFPLAGRLNGAAFVDAGNIWSLKNENSRTQFKWNQFYKQLGIGAGVGARLDFTYVIARIDFAYKIHDPAYAEGNRWFNDIKLLNPQIQFGINYPF